MAEENRMKIAVVGPESCGKSTLVIALAQYFNCAYVPEVAREYFAKHAHFHYTIDDVIAIARAQQALEDQLAEQHPLLICDTSPLVCRIWAEVRFGYCPPTIAALDTQANYAATLLCAPDLPWQADPLRENPNNREELFGIYANNLSLRSTPLAIISGLGDARLHLAIKKIERMGITF
jgi:nicotinamide riboside kinase